MSRIHFNALQEALITKLKADAVGWSVSANIYDEVPENSAFPYVEMGLVTDVAAGSKGLDWGETIQTVVIHSDSRGAKEMNSIVGQVVESLTAASVRAAITDNFEIRDNQYQQTQTFKETDGQGDTFRRAEVRISFTVQDNLT